MGVIMKKASLEILKEIEKHGFECYIVGGFVRDYYMGKSSKDVDISTDASPKDLLLIFDKAILPKEKYGAVTLFYKNVRFEITTFRREIKYENRRPIEIEYTKDLKGDIYRRDFTINSLCMNSSLEIIDLLGGRKDIDNKLIRSIGEPLVKFDEDPLRILRAIRFATQLNFKLVDSLVSAIKEKKYLLESISYERKISELNKVFTSSNIKYGIELIKELDIEHNLNIKIPNNMKYTKDILGIWTQIDEDSIYPYTYLEKRNIKNLRKILSKNTITKLDLYNYGLYLCSIAGEILGINKKEIIRLNNSLNIRSTKDINIDINHVLKELNRKPGPWIKDMYDMIILDILDGRLSNNSDDIIQYIKNVK